MKRTLLDRLACPSCGGALVLSSADPAEDVEKGTLGCARCGAEYPIIRNVPRFVPEATYADSFGYQWNLFPRTQLDSHTGLTISRDRFFATTGWRPEELTGATVLDAGCGSGRFAEVALELGAEVVAIDFSAAVDACWLNLSGHPRMHVVQASIYNLPFCSGSFDFVYSLGVLQHTPDPAAAFAALVPQLRPGGKLAVDVYIRDWRRRLHPKYLLRPLTTRIPARRLFRAVQALSPALLRVSRVASRVPRIGGLLRRLVPVANYEGVYPLDDRQLLDWAILDTFDWLSPAYDDPATPEMLGAWLEAAGLEERAVMHPHHLVGRGVRPTAPPPQSNPGLERCG